jgi:hypothetical protein
MRLTSCPVAVAKRPLTAQTPQVMHLGESFIFPGASFTRFGENSWQRFAVIPRVGLRLVAVRRAENRSQVVQQKSQPSAASGLETGVA